MATVQTGGDRLRVIPINPVDGLEHYLKMVEGLPRRGRLKCDGRSVLLVSPGIPHEGSSDRCDKLLDDVFDVLEIPARPMASTLYRLPNPDQNKAFEPDRSYYIQNVETVLVLSEIDLSVCPPPDLVIEIVDKNPALRSLGICLRLRVPEVWVYKVREHSLVFKGFTEEHGRPPRHVNLKRSRVLPFLTPEDVSPWLEATSEFSYQYRRRARAWAETELLPRFRTGGFGE